MGITLFIAGLFFKMWLDISPLTLHSFEHNIQFTHVLALYDRFGVDVPLNFDITRSLTPAVWILQGCLKCVQLTNYYNNCIQYPQGTISNMVNITKYWFRSFEHYYSKEIIYCKILNLNTVKVYLAPLKTQHIHIYLECIFLRYKWPWSTIFVSIL